MSRQTPTLQVPQVPQVSQMSTSKNTIGKHLFNQCAKLFNDSEIQERLKVNIIDPLVDYLKKRVLIFYIIIVVAIFTVIVIQIFAIVKISQLMTVIETMRNISV